MTEETKQDLEKEQAETAKQEDMAADTGAMDEEAKTKAGEETAEEPCKDSGEAESAVEGSDTEEPGAEETAAEGSEEKKGPAPDKKDKKIEELNDKYRRLFAEFDNFRKRTETEKAGMFAEGERAVLVKVLPLIDNFERALANIPEEEKGSPFADGVEKIYRSFMDQLKELGVTPIEAVGMPFDANLHNAVMHVEDEEVEESVVIEEFQKGYMFRDKVLRYSMVKVAN